MLRGLTTVSFFASDVAAAKAWYTELLGIEPYFVRPVEGMPAYVEFRIGAFAITPFRVNHSIPDGMGFAIRTPLSDTCSKLDAVFVRLVRSFGSLVMEPRLDARRSMSRVRSFRC